MSYLYAQQGSAAPPRSPYAQPASIQAQAPYGTPGAQYTTPANQYITPANQYTTPANQYNTLGGATTPSYAATKSPYMAPATIGAGTMFMPTTPAAHSQIMSPSQPAQYLPTGGQLTVGAAAAQQAPAQPFNGNVQAGSVTYTTTTDALGRITYHHFK